MFDDNIQIRYRAFGWDEWKTHRSHASKSLSVPELTKVLKDLMKDEKKKKRPIPEKSKVPIPQRKEMAILGTESTQRGKLGSNTVEVGDEFELKSLNDWKKRELEGFTSVHSNCQKRDDPAVDDTLGGKGIEVLSEFDMDEEGTEKESWWCSQVVERICDGTWVIPGKARKCLRW